MIIDKTGSSLKTTGWYLIVIGLIIMVVGSIVAVFSSIFNGVEPSEIIKSLDATKSFDAKTFDAVVVINMVMSAGKHAGFMIGAGIGMVLAGLLTLVVYAIKVPLTIPCIICNGHSIIQDADGRLFGDGCCRKCQGSGEDRAEQRCPACGGTGICVVCEGKGWTAVTGGHRSLANLFRHTGAKENSQGATG